MSRKIDFAWSLKRNKLYWLTGILLLFCIGGVFAYWTQELIIHNEFKTARYETVLEEEFESPDNWCPGEQINKDVWVVNKGKVPVFSKIVLTQEWMRSRNIADLADDVITPAAGEQIPLMFGAEEEKEYAAQIQWGEQVVLLSSEESSGMLSDIKRVDSIEAAAGKWLLANEEPDEDGNYILYYIGILEAGESSPLAVEAVTMNPRIEPAIIEKRMSYNKETKSWVTTVQRNDTYDYECARYTMLVTMTTVQATENAVQTIFSEKTDSSDVVAYLAAHAKSEAGTSDENKKLYFEEKNGTMTWNPVRGSDGNWFMDINDMLPGENYKNMLQIENGSKKTYKLYLQAIALEQDEEKDKLLELISMKVMVGSKVLYEGTAGGTEYDNGNLQNVIYVGTYEPSASSELEVQLGLSKDVGIEYNNMLTKTDWKFMVTEVQENQKQENNEHDNNVYENKIQIIQSPKTGDTSNLVLYLILMVGAFSGVLVVRHIKSRST